MASPLNITRQTYSHYETGRITPSTNSLYNLAKLYGIPVENFLDLVVTYSINDDFVSKPNDYGIGTADDLNQFLKHINAPDNSKKFKYLDRHDKLLLYYYSFLDSRDQNDIVIFTKIKLQNRRA